MYVQVVCMYSSGPYLNNVCLSMYICVCLCVCVSVCVGYYAVKLPCGASGIMTMHMLCA